MKVSMNISWFLILSVFLLNISAIAQAQSARNPFLDRPDTGWQEVQKDDSSGLVMFNRESVVEDAIYKDFKGVITIETALNSIIRLLEDTEVSPGWMHNCVSAEKVFEDDTKNESIKHFKTKEKIFFKYDSVVRDVRKQDVTTKVVTISIMSAHNRKDPVPDYTRTEKLYGKWELRPVSTNRVEVIYELYSEPPVPIGTTSMVEGGLEKYMLENLKGMKEVLECRHERINCQKYKEGKVYVQELVFACINKLNIVNSVLFFIKGVYNGKKSSNTLLLRE